MKNDTFLLERVLEMCQILDGERSKMGIKNILTGKRNHQTWSDLYFYQLHKYYRFFLNEDESIINEIFSELQQLGMIFLQENEVVRMTIRGENYLLDHQADREIFIRDGRILRIMEEYWSFLHLLIQTLSNLLVQKNRFLPVVREAAIQTQVKNWITQYGVKDGARGLYSELQLLLTSMPHELCDLIVLRLSGEHRIGLTMNQLSKLLQKTYWENKWNWESALNQLYVRINAYQFEYLPSFINKNDLLLSNSCKETYALLREHKSIAEMSKIRNLKESTIMDHIIEIALQTSDHDFSNFITDDEIKEVRNCFERLGSMRIKSYKLLLPNFTYFQIRLALTLLDRGSSYEA